MSTKLKIIIVAENASARMGGEAILPLHYFKFLNLQGVETWLLTHERVKDELQEILDEKDFNRVYFIPDTKLQIFCDYIHDFIPYYFTEFIIQWIIHTSTDMRQRKYLKPLIKQHDINIVHQPTPVSPRVPSFIYNIGAPVIIGAMNGGMQFPPAFSNRVSKLENFIMRTNRILSRAVNCFIPGKKKAALLLVANARTRQALPKCASRNVLELVENGVDLSLWQMGDQVQKKYFPFPFLLS